MGVRKVYLQNFAFEHSFKRQIGVCLYNKDWPRENHLKYRGVRQHDAFGTEDIVMFGTYGLWVNEAGRGPRGECQPH